MINYLLLVSRQGKLRLAKWFTTMSSKAKAKLVYDITQLVLARKPKMCNVLEYRDTKFITSMFKVIYRRYASLYFICEVGAQENELMTLELIHRYVEVLDRYFGNVCELDLIFNFQQAYTILDELVIGGEMQDSSKKAPLNEARQVDQFQLAEDVMDKIQQSYLI